jgi:threonine/homoserine/homoserine lactone efflux protein
LILAGGKLAELVKGNRKIGLWLDRGLGALLVALGVRLALTTR